MSITDEEADDWFAGVVFPEDVFGDEDPRMPDDRPPAEVILPRPGDPMAVARAMADAWQDENGTLTLQHWRGEWMRWTGPHWAQIDDAALRADLYPRLEHAKFRAPDKNGTSRLAAWAPTRSKVANLLEAVAAITHLSAETEAPAWLDAAEAMAEASQIVACRNGLLDVATRQLCPLTPRYFNRTSVPFDYAPHAPVPARWLAFLQTIWPEDPEAIHALQEFAGYVVSGRTDLQKIMLIIGPPRSGKGTIARVLTDLIGKANMAGPTMSSLATNFGLADLISKSLAIVADGRLPRQGGETVVERLLSISGEDTITVDRKHRDAWSGRIPARFLLLSNELPAFADASGAIASRLIVLTMEHSFLGREDTTLDRDLKAELAGIFNWALDGLTRLHKRGRFIEPASSAEAVAMLAASVSPIKAFLGEHCTVGPDQRVPTDVLFEAWRTWCDLSGRDHKGTKETFGRNLLAAIPGLKRAKPRINGIQVPCYLGVKLGTDD